MNSRFSILLTVASIGVLSACASSVAQEASAPQADERNQERHVIIRRSGGGERQRMMLLSSDADGDGRISKDEFTAKHHDKFDEMDADSDGFVDEDEFSEFISARVDHAMARFDIATSGMDFDEGEMREFELEMEILKEEMEEFGEEMRGFGRAMAHSAGRDFRRNSHRREGGTRLSDENFEELQLAQKDKAMEHMDTDGDGKISQDEYPGPDRRFARMDENEDGFVTSDELRIRLHIVREMDGFPPQMQERVFIKIDEDDEE